ncbi:MAG: sigma-54 dependent transcriptional regulator [Acidobacteriota bacterium]|nr:sigma-54-dependent Fis family transcriptional regulator [Acidobacteriota bacterium]HOF83046.1 sigma-54 dependent transcriptional regulator [Candidatus Aminicenantes bacterium]MDD8028597.1 sigma-54 dependent transcriptional regulator [Acidobacteriota bacterium]MDD8033309.1 sigma-54 dependent transcriptional regulator [Acidobacteriota bacterium]MDD8038075.1 sigma-54 dependent transcriptional regulator [Acidobacteriota bacterium]
MNTILIVDDERSILELLSVILKKEGYAVLVNPGTPSIYEDIEQKEFDLVISDIKMPQVDGMEVLRRVKAEKPTVPVIMITAYASVKQAVEALRLGAMDYIMKPFDIEEIKVLVANGLEHRRLLEENKILKQALREETSFENMIGKSRPMQEVFTLIEKVAATDSTVLITGESGTGKELAARAIHANSRRRDRAFVSINCAALPENLLESELFGHVKGSFTGAISDKKGMFETAHAGTIFLDEVGETSPWTQVKLFRVLQERMIRRVGGNEEIPVNVRIIAATNQNLRKRIEEGKFREELFYRLNVISVDMPPLRRRPDDIPLLIQHFLRKHCERMGRKIKRLTPEVTTALTKYSWPGNVRELENIIERLCAVEERETITAESLPDDVVEAGRVPVGGAPVLLPGFDLEAHLDQVAQAYLKEASEKAAGNMRRMAELLGVSYRSLRYLMKKYQIRRPGAAE